MTPEEWLTIGQREYLAGFVRDGGAAVKVLVPADDPSRQALLDGLQALSGEAGYFFAAVNGETARLHMIDKLFHAVAQQIPWEALTQAFLRRLFGEQGLKLPAEPEGATLAAIAALNEYPELLFRREVSRWLDRAILQDYQMSREFRLAMLQLCEAHLEPTNDPGLEQSIKAWLGGELRLLSTVKRAQIYQRVARHNARHMLDSLVHWLTLAGHSGLVLTLDVSRYAQTVRPADRTNGLYYTSANAMDAYEVVRQFIDAADELERCFIAVVAGQEFLHDDRRGLRSYQALYLRVADEVRDRHRQNPLASLVRLEAES
ncbi:MAG: BREX system ATP-binding domain-containing protein [Chloroflexota bacterium]